MVAVPHSRHNDVSAEQFAQSQLTEPHAEQVIRAPEEGKDLPVFPEAALAGYLVNEWAAPAAVVFANWLDQVAATKSWPLADRP